MEHRTGLVIKGEMIEFDLLAKGEATWLVEVRYRKTPVRAADVEKFLKKLSKMKGWSRLAKLPKGKCLWFFSAAVLKKRPPPVCASSTSCTATSWGFNALCRAVKIGELPVLD